MRHRKIGRRFNRSPSHRHAMLKNLMISLIEHEQIRTTLARAKEMRRFVEPLITLSKKDSVANRRLAFNRLRSKMAVGKLFSIIGPASQKRAGGYLRILKCGYRHSDCAPAAIVELVDRENFVKSTDKKKPDKKIAKKKTAKSK